MTVENTIAYLRNNGYVERVGSRKMDIGKLLQMQ